MRLNLAGSTLSQTIKAFMSVKLNLQVGKAYLDRKGNKVKIVSVTVLPTHPFLSEGGVTYTSIGMVHDYMDVSRDLVSEYIEPGQVSPDKVQVRYVLGETTKYSEDSEDSEVVFKYVYVYLEGGKYKPSTRHQTLELPEAAARALCGV